MSMTTSSRPFLAAVEVALAAAIAVPWLVAPPALAAAGTATTTTIETSATVVPPTFDATISVRPNPVVPGQVGTCVMVDLDGVNGICMPLDGSGDVVATFTAVPQGDHVIHAAFSGGGDFLGSSATLGIEVGRESAVQLTVTPNPATTSDLVRLTARVVIGSGDITGGSLSIEDQTTGALIATVQVGPTKDTVVLATRFPAGDHPLVAYYSGNADITEATTPLTLSVTPDTTVGWLGFAKMPATFYPVVDDYRDTLRVATTLEEQARVVIRVKDPNGHVVRTADLGVRPAGPAAWVWRGRNATGSLLPAGTYTVTMRATDMSGNSDAESVAINLSRKRLHWYTQTLTKHGDGYGYTWHPADGSISQARSAYPDGVRLTAGEAFVGVRYAFTLRAATRYGNLSFRVLGKSPAGLTSTAGIWYGSMRNPMESADRTMPYARSTIGPRYRWWTVTKSQAHRDGRRVVAQVLVEQPLLVGGGLNSFDIEKVQLVYRYAILE